MTRRGFLEVSTVIGLSVSMKAEGLTPERKEIKGLLPVITAVQEHMFPEGSNLPSEDRESPFLMTGFFIDGRTATL